MDNKPTIRAGRRRPTTTTRSSARERADAPQRETGSSSGGTVPSSTGSGGTSSGGTSSSGGFPFSLPTGGRGKSSCLMIGLFVVLLICIFIGMKFMGGDGLGSLLSGGQVEQPAIDDQAADDQTFSESELAEPIGAPQATSTKSPTRTPRPTTEPGAATAGGDTWTVMLYQDADDQVLEQDIYVDLNEAERTGSSDQVKVVAQVDRFRGAYQGDGDWTSTRRFLITQDDDLSRVNSEEIADLGEVNMSDANTLIDFVTWAVETYPADRYALILSDHGMGWPGGWSDPAPGGSGDARIPLASKLGNMLYLHELDQALETIRSSTDIDKFELIGMDACLMGQLEVFTALEPHARYAVASEEVEPALGWAYTGFLDALVNNPEMDGAQLGQYIVDSYIVDDQRIIDDEARAEMMRGGSMGGLFGMFGSVSKEQLAQQMGQAATLTAVDLSKLPNLMDQVNDFAYKLQGDQQAVIARARSYAQSFTSIFGSKVPPSYIDFGHFLYLLKKESANQTVLGAADNVLAAMGEAIIAEKHGSKKPGATGLAIYYPNSQIYQNPVAGAQSYTAIAERFADASLWDDFLLFHYTNEPFAADQVERSVPASDQVMRAPGSGDIQVGPLELSKTSISIGQTTLMSADVSGDNIGYIYLFVGYLDTRVNSLYILDMDYLETDPTREVNGIYYPTWSESNEFRLEFEWEPIVFNITDGQSTYTTLFQPRSYGVSDEQAVYSVDGVYAFEDGSEPQNARLLFSNGVLQQVYSFTGDDVGAPHEIIPVTGDRFTINETWLDLDSSGQSGKPATQEGGTLIFGKEVFTWEVLNAAAGKYVIGFIVEDLDGNRVQTFSQVTVK
jgi:hypothetical protein